MSEVEVENFEMSYFETVLMYCGVGWFMPSIAEKIVYNYAELPEEERLEKIKEMRQLKKDIMDGK